MKLWRAVVEDNLDPLENGRVRVRIFGMHTAKNENSGEAFNFIKSSDLPWAEVIGGTDFGLISGIGISSVLRQGTWVWVVLDEENPNKPLIVGTIKGTTATRTDYAGGEGFNDKDGVYPLANRVGESDTNRLARAGTLTDTIHQTINDNIDVNSNITDVTSGADVSQTEPSSTSDSTTYPECAVLETASGHVFEFDDTTGNERIRLYHKTGSYIEIKPDGSIVQKAINGTGASHYIHMADVNEHIAGSVKKYLETNLDEIVDGAVKRKIGGALSEHVVGNVTLKVDGNLTYDVTGTVSFISGQNMALNSGANLTVDTTGTHTVNNGGNHSVTAPRIDLN